MAGNLPSLFDDDMFFSSPEEVKKPDKKKKQASAVAEKGDQQPTEDPQPVDETPEPVGETAAEDQQPTRPSETVTAAAAEPGMTASAEEHAKWVKPSLELPETPSEPKPEKEAKSGAFPIGQVEVITPKSKLKSAESETSPDLEPSGYEPDDLNKPTDDIKPAEDNKPEADDNKPAEDPKPAAEDSKPTGPNTQGIAISEDPSKHPSATPVEAGEEQIGLPDWKLDKNYYTIGEVAGFFKVNISHIRFWTNEFKLKPRTTRKGDRLYTPDQIGRLRLIHHLVKEKKHTLQGAKERLQSGSQQVNSKLQLKDALTALRTTLLELRDELA